MIAPPQLVRIRHAASLTGIRLPGGGATPPAEDVYEVEHVARGIAVVWLHRCLRVCQVGDSKPFCEIGANQSAARFWVDVW